MPFLAASSEKTSEMVACRRSFSFEGGSRSGAGSTPSSGKSFTRTPPCFSSTAGMCSRMAGKRPLRTSTKGPYGAVPCSKLAPTT
ncbi:hypothetical protein D3C72_680260 [compost metagenome]